MKRFLFFLVILALTSSVFGQEDPQTIHESGKNQVIVSYGEITAPNDTFWIPGHTVLSYLDADSTNDPNVWGINLSQHRLLGVEVIIIQPDTTLNDSLLVDLWTGYYGHKDSLILAAAATQITDGTLFDTCITFPTCPKARHWYFLSDSTESPEYWWQRYAWLRLRTHMTEIFRTDTTFTGRLMAMCGLRMAIVCMIGIPPMLMGFSIRCSRLPLIMILLPMCMARTHSWLLP